LIWAALWCLSTAISAVAGEPGAVRGVVLDLQTREPIAKARVYLPDHRMQTITDDLGRFEIRGIDAAEVEICVTTVGFGLLRKRVALSPGGDVELEFMLGQDTLKRGALRPAGFYELRDGRYYLSEQRNVERVPYYSRMDFRISKAIPFDRWKLTLFVEAFNLLGRENHRYTGLNSVRPDGEARLAHDTMLPFLPFAGLTFEF
jgi:hypothetical protein